MNILFLTEHGEGIGYGHLNRCTALADGFAEYNSEITLISSGNTQNYELERDYNFINENWKSAGYLEKILPRYDIIVTDSYQAEKSILKYIGQNAGLPVYLIDSEMKYYPGGIVLFPSACAQENDFDNSKNLDVIAGREYLLFTKELWKTHKNKIARKLTHIGVSIGGIANHNMVNILSEIRSSIPDVEKITLFGDLEHKIKNEITAFSCEAKGFLKKDEYVEELLKQDALISNGGQSLNESLLLGIPTAALICADNQKNNARYWEKLGIASCLDIRKSFDTSKFVEKIQKLASYSFRKDVFNKSHQFIDAGGSVRSVERILKVTKHI